MAAPISSRDSLMRESAPPHPTLSPSAGERDALNAGAECTLSPSAGERDALNAGAECSLSPSARERVGVRVPSSRARVSSRRRAQDDGGGGDGLDDALIARAAAEDGGEARADLGLRRRWVRAEEIERGQEHPRRAEAALESM